MVTLSKMSQKETFLLMACSISISLGFEWFESDRANGNYTITASTVLLLIDDNQLLFAPNWQLMNCNRYHMLDLDTECSANRERGETEPETEREKDESQRQFIPFLLSSDMHCLASCG